MKNFLVLFLIACSITTYSQKVHEKELEHFDKIRITNQVKVFLSPGEKESIRIQATGIDFNDIIAEVTGKTLEIGFKRGVHKDAEVDIYLTYTNLRDIHVSASGRASFQKPLTGEKIVFRAHTSGEIDATVNLTTFDVVASKGGIVHLKGKAQSYEAKISLGATLSALDLEVDTAYLKIGSKGVGKVNATKLVDASVRSGATLTLTGNPKRKIKTGLGATILEQ